MFNQDEPTDTQREILRVADRNPDMTNKGIAREVGCSESYVSKTLNEYGRSGGLLGGGIF